MKLPLEPHEYVRRADQAEATAALMARLGDLAGDFRGPTVRPLGVTRLVAVQVRYEAALVDGQAHVIVTLSPEGRVALARGLLRRGGGRVSLLSYEHGEVVEAGEPWGS